MAPLPKPGTGNFEYPDAAGYPDGTGTLNEGTDPQQEDESIVAVVSEFLDGDARDE